MPTIITSNNPLPITLEKISLFTGLKEFTPNNTPTIINTKPIIQLIKTLSHFSF